MGSKIMKNLSANNIIRDCGSTSVSIIKNLELACEATLPSQYVNFILCHNGARILARCFNFYDKDLKMQSSESIAFIKVEKIQDYISSLLHQTTADPSDPDVFKFYQYFSEKLIPFGDTGGGDFICFDYRDNPQTDNPPVVLWCHDANDSEGRISFIANNFEEFINMLHEPED